MFYILNQDAVTKPSVWVGFQEGESSSKGAPECGEERQDGSTVERGNCLPSIRGTSQLLLEVSKSADMCRSSKVPWAIFPIRRTSYPTAYLYGPYVTYSNNYPFSKTGEEIQANSIWPCYLPIICRSFNT